jgi:hypothetical protein
MRLLPESARAEGIGADLKDSDQCPERKAQQSTAADACAVGEYISGFHDAAAREMLATLS